MGVDATERQEPATPSQPASAGGLARVIAEAKAGFRNLQWREVLLFGIGAGTLMPFTFFQPGVLTFVAGIIPVGAGLLVGRRVRGYYGMHGFMTGLIGAIVSMGVLTALLFLTPLGANAQASLDTDGQPLEPAAVLLQLGLFITMSLLTFCTFGATMSGRAEERRRSLRRETEARGGTLQRPGVIRTPDDIRGLSLPQLGSYVNNLFKKHGFQFKDYRFIDKDKHLDLWLEYEGEPWHLRLSVADKVSPGTIESLNQELKREGCRKGVVVTSTEFMPTALKAAKGRPIALIDGTMLYEIAEK